MGEAALRPAHSIIPAGAAAGDGASIGAVLAAKPHAIDVTVLGCGASVNGIRLFPAFHVASLLVALKVRARVRVGLHGTAGCPVGSCLPTT